MIVLADLLHEIHGLGLYVGKEWQRYIGFFPENRVPAGLDRGQSCSVKSDNEIKRRICHRTGADGAGADLILSPKIMTINALAGSPSRQQMTLGVVSGAFDLLHLGHLECIEYAARQLAGYPNGKVCALILSDQHIRDKKGHDRPVLSLAERMSMLAAVRLVDFVVPLEEPGCLTALTRLRPELFCKPEDDLTQRIVAQEVGLVRSYDGRVALIPSRRSGRLSTTFLVEEIRQQYCSEGIEDDSRE
jgi:cytidyltransferase-like protein